LYAIVRCGGRQEKAAEGDVLTVDRLPGEVGSSVTFPVVLVVDDGNVISDPSELGKYQVSAEILGPAAGPKIRMIHYKNKTGYRRRLGHRQRYTEVKITGIGTVRAGAARARADKTGQTDTSAAKNTSAATTTEAKAPAAKPSGAKPSDAKPSAAKPSGPKTSEAKPSDAKPSETKSTAAKAAASRASAVKAHDSVAAGGEEG
jgi:large subunit ribosomal protein L21